MTIHEHGIHQLTLERQNGDNLLYTLAIPETYNPDDSPVPLVVGLHYAGHGQPYFGTGILIDLIGPALHELEAIIVTPDCPSGIWAEPKAEQAVIDLVDYLQETYSIDTDRVVLTGYSMGGMGVWYIAARHPGRFSVAIPVAGQPQRDIDADNWGVPLYALHSSDDELIPVGPTGLMIDKLRDANKRVGMLMIEGITHFEVPRFVPHLRSTISWIRRVWELNEEA